MNIMAEDQFGYLLKAEAEEHFLAEQYAWQETIEKIRLRFSDMNLTKIEEEVLQKKEELYTTVPLSWGAGHPKENQVYKIK